MPTLMQLQVLRLQDAVSSVSGKQRGLKAFVLS